mmetsp:Transcript_16705/g.45960  ORF Transcript_16705/g.45960 Transcript_16705/m.45960 type:complete len:209 (+) Transcript_16705:792-1418(+)
MGDLDPLVQKSVRLVQASDKVAVPIHVVDPGVSGPELGLAHPGGREGTLLAAVGPVPLVAQHHFRAVGGMLQGVVVPVGLALLNLSCFLPDGNHRMDESINLLLGLGLGGLNHEGASHRPGHGGSVETVVHQALGHVLSLDPSALLEWPQVQDEFVCAGACGALEQDGVVLAQLHGHVVSLEDGVLRSLSQASRAHEGDVGIADGQDE